MHAGYYVNLSVEHLARQPLTLLHGDLNCHNLMVQPDSKIRPIGWGYAASVSRDPRAARGVLKRGIILLPTRVPSHCNLRTSSTIKEIKEKKANGNILLQ